MPTADEEAYAPAVANAAIGAIIDLTDGVVEPVGAIQGLCLAIAMVAGNTGGVDSPKVRRELADSCRKLVLQYANTFSTGEAGWDRARKVEPGEIN